MKKSYVKGKTPGSIFVGGPKSSNIKRDPGLTNADIDAATKAVKKMADNETGSGKTVRMDYMQLNEHWRIQRISETNKEKLNVDKEGYAVQHYVEIYTPGFGPTKREWKDVAWFILGSDAISYLYEHVIKDGNFDY